VLRIAHGHGKEARHQIHVPVPANVVDSLPALAPSATLRFAILTPVDVGLKLTLTVQLAPMPSELPQSLL
jgi:hypothetical protein